MESAIGAFVWFYFVIVYTIGGNQLLVTPKQEEELARAFVQSAVLAARSQAAVTYEEIVYDRRARALSVEGLSVAREEFAFDLDTARITTHGGSDHLGLSIDLDGLRTSVDDIDLPDFVRFQARALDLDEIDATGVIHISYDIASSRTDTVIELDIEGLGRLAATVDLDNLHAREEDFDPVVGGNLVSATLTFENDGAVALGTRLATGDEPNPETARTLAAQLASLLTAGLGGGQAPTPEVAERIAQVEAEVARFLIEGDRVSISVVPDSPLPLQALVEEAEEIDRNGPTPTLILLDPIVTEAPLNGSTPIALSEVAAGPNATDPVALAVALANGVGVPRSLDRAIEVAEAAALAGDPRAMQVSAEALLARGDASDLARAYRFALGAAASGAPGGSSLTASIESRLPLDVLLSSQDEAAQTETQMAEYETRLANAQNDPVALRILAQDLEAGRSLPRHLTEAYYLSLIAAAAGDEAAARARDRIAGRFDGADPEEQAVWRQVRTEIEERAYADWVNGLGASLAPGE